MNGISLYLIKNLVATDAINHQAVFFTPCFGIFGDCL